MKFLKILFTVCSILLITTCPFVISSCQTVLHGGIEKVPNEFFGAWRVVSHRTTTDSPVTFREKNIDIWNLSSENNVITLSNPFSGAQAQINVREVRGNYVEFVKTGKYDNKLLTDRVKLEVKGNKFSGTDELTLKTISDVDKSVIKDEHATYALTGERISGQEITK